MDTVSSQQHPWLLRRLAAMIYDLCLVLPLIMACVAIAMGIRSFTHEPMAADLGTGELSPQLVQLLAGVVTTLFFSWFWVRNGQTLGMQAWRIQLVGIDGTRVTLSKSIRRCVAATLSAACLGLGYLWCLVDKNKRYWHDYLSGTELILLPKQKKKSKEESSTPAEPKA